VIYPSCRLAIALILLFTAGCAPAAESPRAAPPDRPVRPEPIQAMSQDRLALLQGFFSAEGIARIQRFETDLGSVATVEDFLRAYYAVDSLEYPNLPDTMDAIYPFVNADFGIPGVMSSCEAECTEPSFDRNMDTFAAVAAGTPSDLDDAFVQLVSDFGGSFYGFGSYFMQTWDYGGYSEFGTGIHVSLLQQIVGLQARTDLFSEDLERARNTLFGDMAGYNICFGPSRAAVRSELLAVRGMDWVSEDEGNAIDARLSLLDRTCLDCEQRALETDCASQSCSCASG
jgi:hypothetical protein